jgi:hypothetical protein
VNALPDLDLQFKPLTAYSFDSRALAKAADQLNVELITMCKNVLASPVEDYAGYMRRVGEFVGMRRALEILAGVEKEMR